MKRVLLTGLVLVVVLSVAGAGLWRFSNSTRRQFCGGLTRRLTTDEKVVALTFDDGPTPGDTQTVLESLRAEGVKATFFLIGREMAAHPGLAEAIVRDGHQVGNHTWTHRRMVGITRSQARTELRRTDEALRAAGVTGPIDFRPPFGKKLVSLPCELAAQQRRTVTWDVSVEDFSSPDVRQTADDIARRAVADTRPGSIILLHPMNGRTAAQAAVPQVVRELKGQGYRFVTVQELLAG